MKYFSLKFITYQLLKFLLPRKYKNIFVKIFLKQSFDDHFFDRKYNVDSSSRELEGKEKLHTTFLAGSYKELKHSFNYLIKNCLEPKNINLVDLGCGTGISTRAILKALGNNVYINAHCHLELSHLKGTTEKDPRDNQQMEKRICLRPLMFH